MKVRLVAGLLSLSSSSLFVYFVSFVVPLLPFLFFSPCPPCLRGLIPFPRPNVAIHGPSIGRNNPNGLATLGGKGRLQDGRRVDRPAVDAYVGPGGDGRIVGVDVRHVFLVLGEERQGQVERSGLAVVHAAEAPCVAASPGNRRVLTNLAVKDLRVVPNGWHVVEDSSSGSSPMMLGRSYQ